MKTRRLLALLLTVASVMAVVTWAHAGPVSGKVKRSGKVLYYFTPGNAGTGIPWPEGGELDAPGDVGSMSTKPGAEPHVALANTVFTFLLDMPITFQSPPLSQSVIVGGNTFLTLYLADPEAVAAGGFVEARLFDVGPGGAATQLAGIDVNSDKAWVAGPTAPAKGVYVFGVPQTWEIPKGHSLRIEMDFPWVGGVLLRFYYGDATWAASVALDRFVRVK